MWTLKRLYAHSDGVFGELRDDSGELVAATLEHSYAQEDGSYAPKIPNGEYTCVRSMHRLHGMGCDFETFEVTGVEGHSGLLFHWGNYNKDSEGCVLLGEKIEGTQPSEMITNSRATFAEFMKRLTEKRTFEVSFCY